MMTLLSANLIKAISNFTVYFYFLTYILFLNLIGCDSDNLVSKPEQDDTVIGFTSVPLNANKTKVRGEETIIGNLIADMLVSHANDNGHNIDFAMINGGAIRFNSENRPDGIFPAGNLTKDDVNEMLPFGNTAVIVELTGGELKSTLERAYHQLPIPENDSGSGTFLQVSSSLQVIVDLGLQAQVLDELSNPEIITTAGERLITIRVSGQDFDSNTLYTVLVPDFIAEGGDGFVALREIPQAKKIDIGINLALALEEYLAANIPISPIIEGRITFQ